MEKLDYLEYIKSADWDNIRRQHREAGLSGACLCCGATKGITLHHRTYRNLGNEKLKELMPFCWRCHKRVHEFLSDKKLRVSKTHIAIKHITGWSNKKVLSIIAPYYKPKSFKYEKAKKKTKAHWSQAYKEFPEYDQFKRIY